MRTYGVAYFYLVVAGAVALGAAPSCRAEGDIAAGQALYPTCVSCHGARAEGNAATGAPNLTGQSPAYLARQLSAFIEGRRGAGKDDGPGAQMRDALQVFQGPDDATDVAAYLASLPVQRVASAPPGAALDTAAGRRLYGSACSTCHGSAGEGSAALGAPRLAGQDVGYLARQYAQFKSGQRGSDAADAEGQRMRASVPQLTDAMAERAALDYAAHLGP